MALVLVPGVQINNGDVIDGDNTSVGADNLMDLVRLATGSGIDSSNFDAAYVNGAASVPSLRSLVVDGASTTATAALSAGDPRVAGLSGGGLAIANRIATSGTPVTISSTPPSAGQTIIASNATTAAWGTPSVSANITGTGTLASSSTTVTGTGAAFTSQLKVGYQITADSETRRVISITSATVLEVDAAWTAPLGPTDSFTYQITPSERPFNTVIAKTANYTLTTADRGALFTMDTTSNTAGTGAVTTVEDSTTVTGNGSTLFATEAPAGSRITIGTETRWVASVTNDNVLIVDRAFELVNTTVAFTIGAQFTFTLPASAGFAEGDSLSFEKISDDANTMRITPNGADTIDGLNTAIQYRQSRALVTIVKNGASWRIGHERYKAGEVMQRVRIQTRAAGTSTAALRWLATGQPTITSGANLGSKLALTFTPKSANSRLRFSGLANLSSSVASSGNVLLMLGIARTGDTNCIAVGTSKFSAGTAPESTPIEFEGQSPAASAQTYTLLGNCGDVTSAVTTTHTMYLNRSSATASIFTKQYTSFFQIEEVAI